MNIQHSSTKYGLKNRSDVVWKHFVDDFGGVGDGVTDNRTAYGNFRTWAKSVSGWKGIRFPPGSYVQSNGAYEAAGPGGWPPSITYPFLGIDKLIIYGYGAGLPVFGSSVPNNADARAAIDTVAAGSTTLKLKDIDRASAFAVGGMILLGGLDLQTGWGYPPNSHFQEWCRIASIDDDIITLEAPIKYSYRDDWPRFFEGNNFEIGGFGAATIARTIPSWDVEQVLYGPDPGAYAGQVYCFLRKVTIIDPVSRGAGWIIGASSDMSIIRQKHYAYQEVDKLTTKALIENPVHTFVEVQSSSVDELTVRGGTSNIQGTARHMRVEGGVRQWANLGPLAYGISDEIVLKDCVFTQGINGNFFGATALGDTLAYEGDGVFRYSGGGFPSWFVPGAVAALRAASGSPGWAAFHYMFRILGVRADGDDILLDTSIEGDELPTFAGSTNAAIYRHPAPNLTVINCTGSPSAEELSMMPPNSPFGIFTRRTYTGVPHNPGSGPGQFPWGPVYGRIVHMKINVVQAYTGSIASGNYKVRLGGQFVTQEVNLKIAGERVITPEGVTGTQTGDTDLSTYAGGAWVSNPSGFVGNGSTPVDVSSEDASVRPIVTVEILTDQEIPAAA